MSVSQARKIWAVVPAAGIGERMQSDRPKQYILLGQRRIIDHVLGTLCRSERVDGVFVILRKEDKWWHVNPFTHPKLCTIRAGGKTRAETVLNALQRLLKEQIGVADDWVMVHDAVRPCLQHADINRLIAAAQAHDAGAILANRLTDTLKQVSTDSIIHKTVDMPDDGVYWRSLTPQIFRCGLLESALRQALEQGRVPTDESAAMERIGVYPTVVNGNPTNIKITFPADLRLAAYYLESQMDDSNE